jgi:hypothetical protein
MPLKSRKYLIVLLSLGSTVDKRFSMTSVAAEADMGMRHRNISRSKENAMEKNVISLSNKDYNSFVLFV